jgi:hypothetical protein
MRNGSARRPVVDELENRSLLSFFGLFGGGSGGTQSAAVQADLAKIQTDRQTLQTDVNNLRPTLQADAQAIGTAITNSTSVQAAKTTLKTDVTAWQTTIKADWTALASATDSATRTADVTKLQNDWRSASSAISADIQAVFTAINNDAGVQAARQKLQTDQQPIVADGAVVIADYMQLHTDLQAQNSSGSGSGGWWWF